MGERALFFRVLEVLPAERRLRLRLERFNLYWQQEPVTIPWNATLEAASGGWGWEPPCLLCCPLPTLSVFCLEKWETAVRLDA